MPSFPKFLLSNVRSMVNKIDEIQGVLSTNKCDILKLTESWLTSKVSDALITIPDYKHICKDRPNDQRGGGICTYLKRNCNPSKWWNSVERLAGLSKRQPLNSIYHNGQILKEQEMAEHIANSFFHVSKDISGPLQDP